MIEKILGAKAGWVRVEIGYTEDDLRSLISRVHVRIEDGANCK